MDNKSIAKECLAQNSGGSDMVDLKGFLLRRIGISLAVSVMIMVTVSCSSIPYRTSPNLPVCPDGTAPAMPPEFTRVTGITCVANGGFPLCPKQAPVPRARQIFSENDRDVPDVFVGLAISGGGSRAAAFGMAVLEQLKEVGILQHVTAISTTSGGGLAGAYYAVKGDSINWDDAKQLMGTNFLKR